MSLIERVEKDYVTAYKSKDALRLSVLRHLKTAAKNLQVQLMRPVTEEEFLDVIMKQAKQRQDAMEQFRSGGRHELADKEAAEYAVLQEYMPKPLSPEETEEAIREAVQAVDAHDVRDMGRVMNHIMAAHKGRVDGKTLSSAVRAALQRK